MSTYCPSIVIDDKVECLAFGSGEEGFFLQVFGKFIDQCLVRGLREPTLLIYQVKHAHRILKT